MAKRLTSPKYYTVKLYSWRSNVACHRASKRAFSQQSCYSVLRYSFPPTAPKRRLIFWHRHRPAMSFLLSTVVDRRWLGSAVALTANRTIYSDHPGPVYVWSLRLVAATYPSVMQCCQHRRTRLLMFERPASYYLGHGHAAFECNEPHSSR